MHWGRTLWTGLASGAGWLAVAPAMMAQEAGDGRWSQDLLAELQVDHTDDTDTGSLTVEYGFAARLMDGWTIEGAAILEPVAETTGDSWFESEGAFVEQLSLNYGDERFGLTLGKFNPLFGAAAAMAPGLYGMEIGEGYELAERVGVGGQVNLTALLSDGSHGDHVLSGAAFTADRSFLSGSIGQERPRLRLADGGAGNTEGWESTAVSLDGLYPSGWGYTLGWRRLPGSDLGEADETGVVAGLSQTGLAVGPYGLDLLAEAARFDNADGVDGEERTDYTLSAIANRSGWRFSAILSGQSFGGSALSPDTTRTELMAGRELGAGFVLDLGIMAVDQDGEDSTVGGLRLAWAPEG